MSHAKKATTPKPRVILDPRVVAALVTAVATIVAAAVGSLLTTRAIQQTNPETYNLTVDVTKFPLQQTPVEIGAGDELEVLVMGAHSTVLNCGLGDTTVMGTVHHEYQPNTVLPNANICSFVGRIGPEAAPHFPIGAYTKIISDISGSLALGLNDVIPEKCDGENCFADNTGTLFVRVTVFRK